MRCSDKDVSFGNNCFPLISVVSKRSPGFIVNPKNVEARGGSVVLDVSPLAPEHASSVGHAVAATMNSRDYVLDYRVGAGIRLAPHFYTKDSELEQVITEMHHVIETRSFTEHLERGKVT